jgi:drug/metabolite transporter (DMT)-like permease
MRRPQVVIAATAVARSRLLRHLAGRNENNTRTGKGMNTSSPWAGLALAAAVALSFAANTAAARLSFDHGMTPLTMNAARLAVACLLLFVVLRATGVATALPRRTRLIAWALGPLMCLYQLALLSALETIPLGLAVLIFYTFPIMTSAWTWASGRERPTARGVVAVLVAFGGLALALDVTGSNLHPTGVLLAFLSALGLTVMLQVNHRLVGSGDSRPVTLAMAASATATAALVVLSSGVFALPGTTAGWTAVGVSTLLYSFAIIFMFVAMTMIGPVRMALTMNLEPVASMLLGLFLLGQPLTPVQIFGGALVILAVLLVRLPPAARQQGAKSHG